MEFRAYTSAKFGGERLTLSYEPFTASSMDEAVKFIADVRGASIVSVATEKSLLKRNEYDIEITRVKQLVNFSHSLSAAAKTRLEEMVGPVQEIVIPCQLDMEAPLRAQLDALLEQWQTALLANGRAGNGYGMDLYIPPALSYAAAYITARLSYAQSDAYPPVPPTMVVLRREGTPPQFMPAEVLA